jgi:PAS domain S-box-containing protein
MKVRSILVALSLLAFLSTSAGGVLYHASLKESALDEVNRQAVSRAQTLRNHLSSYLQENLKAARAMAGLEVVRRFLEHPARPGEREEINAILDHFQWALRADVCYVMDRKGDTLASSNREEPRSFVGQNYAFRPYFQRAVRGETAVYMALGVTSEKRGVYYSHPVYGRGPFDGSIGVAVVKAGIEPIEKEFLENESGIVALADPHGVVFASSRPEWLLRPLWRLAPEERERIVASRQFGEEPLNWVGLVREGDRVAVDREGRRFLIHQAEVHERPGWQVLYLTNPDLFLERVSHPLIRISGFLILVLCLIVGVGVFVLFRKASHEITRRRDAEQALRESEETAQALLNAPTDSALLLDTRGRILAANESAARALNERGAEALAGRSIFDCFPAEIADRERARLDEVLRSGRPVRYQEGRGARAFDTHLYPVYDAGGKVIRIAIFSMDVTELKKTEEELRRAQEELSLHSRELERQVRQRTREITGILENTPALVYIKDPDFRYVMVGSRFENLFGLRSREIRGRTDYEIFPREVADQFRANDERVARAQTPIQVEERVPQEDGLHSYLSVKFPLKGEDGRVRAMCGISTDITDLIKAREQLRKLSGRIINSQEQERGLIARELHDELGQLLTALRMDAAWLRQHLGPDRGPAFDRAAAMCALIDKTIDEVRGIAIRLRPGVLDDLGLIDALEWYTEEFDRRYGVACSFHHGAVGPLKDLLATSAYRIAQEALTNVARHAAATHVEVTLDLEGTDLVLQVEDDGEGFDVHRVSENDGLGIAGMRERAVLAGGRLEIRTSPGRGTAVQFRVPVNGRERGDIHDSGPAGR